MKKRNSKKEITFTPFTEAAYEDQGYPKPAIKSLPKWYKDIPPYLNNEKGLRLVDEYRPNLTVKRCMPFTDATSTGYSVTLQSDLLVEFNENNEIVLRWRSIAYPPIAENSGCFIAAQNSGIPIPKEFHNTVYKWSNDWAINVPKGYSIFFTHPINRVDLPFYTLSGMLDADGFDAATLFPFILKKDFSGVIPKGTPIAQFFMIKRENWISKVLKFDEKKVKAVQRAVFSMVAGYYKKTFWNRKTYN